MNSIVTRCHRFKKTSTRKAQKHSGEIPALFTAKGERRICFTFPNR